MANYINDSETIKIAYQINFVMKRTEQGEVIADAIYELSLLAEPVLNLHSLVWSIWSKRLHKNYITV